MDYTKDKTNDEKKNEKSTDVTTGPFKVGNFGSSTSFDLSKDVSLVSEFHHRGAFSQHLLSSGPAKLFPEGTNTTKKAGGLTHAERQAAIEQYCQSRQSLNTVFTSSDSNVFGSINTSGVISTQSNSLISAFPPHYSTTKQQASNQRQNIAKEWLRASVRSSVTRLPNVFVLLHMFCLPNNILQLPKPRGNKRSLEHASSSSNGPTNMPEVLPSHLVPQEPPSSGETNTKQKQQPQSNASKSTEPTPSRSVSAHNRHGPRKRKLGVAQRKFKSKVKPSLVIVSEEESEEEEEDAVEEESDTQSFKSSPYRRSKRQKLSSKPNNQTCAWSEKMKKADETSEEEATEDTALEVDDNHEAVPDARVVQIIGVCWKLEENSESDGAWWYSVVWDSEESSWARAKEIEKDSEYRPLIKKFLRSLKIFNRKDPPV